MFDSDHERFGKLMHAVAEVYDKPLSETKLSIYWEDLKDFNFFDIRDALRKHRKDPKAGQYMPKPADVVKFIYGDKPKVDNKNKHTCPVIEHGQRCGEITFGTLKAKEGYVRVCEPHYYRAHLKDEYKAEVEQALFKHNPLYAVN